MDLLSYILGDIASGITLIVMGSVVVGIGIYVVVFNII